MALTVGNDTYVDVVEADLYVQSHYLSTSSERTSWEALDADDKEVLLRNSMTAIESLPFVGIKDDPEQPLAFPRKIIIRDPCPHNGCCVLECTDIAIPQQVRCAQVEQALYINAYGADISSATRARLQQQGVKSFSLGDLSETYGDGTASNFVYSTRQCSEKVLNLLGNWLSGGFRVCP